MFITAVLEENYMLQIKMKIIIENSFLQMEKSIK